MKKETTQWRNYRLSQELRGPIPHLASATNFSVYGEVDLNSRLFRRNKRARQALRKAVPRDSDGAFRFNNRLDDKRITF